MHDFADVLANNEAYAHHFDLAGLAPVASAGIAVVTCMDSRIDPLGMLGLKPGEAKILRNAGARVTDDVLRTLVLATHLLGVNRVMVVAHTDCKMGSATEQDIDDAILQQAGIDVRSLEFRVVVDQQGTLQHDIQRIRSWPFLPDGVRAGGFIYDVDTGSLTHVA